LHRQTDNPNKGYGPASDEEKDAAYTLPLFQLQTPNYAVPDACSENQHFIACNRRKISFLKLFGANAGVSALELVWLDFHDG
jgi:hypothetical protein